MKSFKKFLAGALSLAMFFSSADFGVFDLSPLIVHAAETATDVYDAVGSYIQLTDAFDDTLVSLDKNPNDGVTSALRDDTSNACVDLEYETNGAAVANGTTFGQIYTFHQKGIDAAAQFKSGNWLTDTDYEAQSGTPTTESLFMTAGGTQWIVNVSYRYLTTDYVRRYKFNATGDNYRYISYGAQNDGWIINENVSYQRTEQFDTHDSEHISSAVTPAHLWPGAYNINLFREYDTLGNGTLGGGMRGNIAYTWATLGDGANSVSSSHRLTADNYTDWCTDETSGGGHLIAANQYVGSGAPGETITLQPAVAECVLYKQSLLGILEDLNNTFDSLDDNYRADWGQWDIDPDYYNSNFRADRASWMFTYASMLRKSANNANDGSQWQNPPAGVINPRGSGDSYFAMHPTCVTYWLDQAGLELSDSMSSSVQSYYITPYELRSVVSTPDVSAGIETYLTSSLLGGHSPNPDSVYLSNVSPIALDIYSGDFINCLYTTIGSGATSIAMSSVNTVDVISLWPSVLSSSLRYYDTTPTPRLNETALDYRKQHAFNTPVSSLYYYFNTNSNNFWTKSATDHIIGFSGFDGRYMAAFNAPHYVQPSSASVITSLSPNILGDGISVNYDINSLLGDTFTYDLSCLGSSANNGAVKGSFSATLCDYYRTLYNVYFLVAPFLVQQDFEDYAFLKEIPGVVTPSSWREHDMWALQNAAQYFGGGYYTTDLYSIFSTKTYEIDPNGQVVEGPPSGIENSLNFTFTFASFPIGGDLDGSMENQASSSWDTMSRKVLQIDAISGDLTTSLTRFTDTEDGANITMWSQRAFGHSQKLIQLKEAYAFLCFASPYLFSEYNYSVKYTLSSDLSADTPLHETYLWASPSTDTHTHNFTNPSGDVSVWHDADSLAKHHEVCSDASNHSQGIWVSTYCNRSYEDLIACSTCGGLAHITCTAEGYTWRDTDGDGIGDRHQKNHTTGGSHDNSCISENDVCPIPCLDHTDPDDPDHITEDEVCEDSHSYCSICGTSSNHDGWHDCPYCAGTGELLCPGCWYGFGDADGDGLDDTDANGNYIHYAPSNVANIPTNRTNYFPVIPCLENMSGGEHKSGYVNYCEYSYCNSPSSPGAYPKGYNEHCHYSNSDFLSLDSSNHILNPEVICGCGADKCQDCLRAERYVTYSESWNIHYGVYKSVEHNDSFAGMGGYDSGWKADYTTCWDQYNKKMNAQYGITQRFNNVKYLDITDYTVWCLDHSETRGLASILAIPVSSTVTSTVVSKLGLVVYDNESDTAGGNVIQNGYVYGTTASGVLKDYVTNAQAGMNRIANSFNTSSEGNVDGYLNRIESYMSYFAAGDDYSEFDNVVADKDPSFSYNNRVNDSPTLTLGKGANQRKYAFKLQSSNPDYLVFNYNSNSQGGRSSTTFYAFVNQAVANTLFTKHQENFDSLNAANQVKNKSLLAYRSTTGIGSAYVDAAINHSVYDGVVTQFTDNSTYAEAAVDESILANTYCTPYSNSILIQGDYLAVQNADGTYTTIVGSMHDTWDDRCVTSPPDISGNNDYNVTKTFSIDTNLCGGRFTLAAHNAIGNRYLSSAGWIMATYSEIASRNNPEKLFTDISGNSLPSQQLTNCLFVHTFVGAINEYRATVFDKAIVDTLNLDADATNDVNGSPAVSVSFQGSANFTRGYLTNDSCYAVDHKLLRQAFVGSEDIYPGVAGKRIMDANVVDGDIDFGDTATTHLTVLKSDAPIGDGSDTTASANLPEEANKGFNIMYVIDLNATDDLDYKNLGTNAGANQNTSDSENRAKTLSYVGYGADTTQGIGTEEITVDGMDTTQLGYLSGDITLFSPHKTYISNFTEGLTDGKDTAGNNFSNGYNPIEHSAKNAPSDIYKTFSRFGVSLSNFATRPVYVDDFNTANTASGSVIPSVFGVYKFSTLYPHVQELNLKRNLPNGEYTTGDTDLLYSVVKTDGANTNTLRVHAGYTRGITSASDHTTNNIVIYNPVSTETAVVMKLGDYTPDAANWGTDGLYLSEGVGSVARNTITVNRYAVSLAETGSELIVTNTSYVEGTSATVTVKSKVLRDESQVDTLAYTHNDYQESAVYNNVTDVYADTSMMFNHEGYYNLDVKCNSSSYYGQIHAYAGDSLYMHDIWLMYLPAFNAELKYVDLAQAYHNGTSDEVHEDTTNRVPLRSGAAYTVSIVDSTTSANTAIKLTKGAALSLCLPVQSEAGSSLFADAIKVSAVVSSGSVVIERAPSKDYSDGISHYKYWNIIATEDCSLAGLSLYGESDCYITYDNNLKMLDVLPTPVGSVTAGSTAFFGTSEYVAGNSSWSTGTTWVNVDLLEVQGESGISGYTATNSIYALAQEVDSTYSWSLTNTAILNPHKVEHTNWRYYVIGNGWTFANGSSITKADIKDLNSPLHSNDTWLQAPNGYYITVGSMDALANADNTLGHSYRASNLVAIQLESAIVLSVYKDSPVAQNIQMFSSLELNDNTGELYGVNGVPVTTVGYAYNPDGTCTGRMLTFDNIQIESDHYLPLSFGNASTVNHTPVSRGLGLIKDCAYDYVWYCFGNLSANDKVNDANAYAYDVKASTNLKHRYGEDDQNWIYDWIEQERTTVVYDSEVSSNPIATSMLYLDDEFTIHWNNLANVEGDGGSDFPTYTGRAKLGRGWNNQEDCYQQVTQFNSDIVDNLNNQNWTDTTKWIYRKYVTFSVDMYCFTDSGSDFVLQSIDDCIASGINWDTQVDPTTPAYNSGVANNVVFIPAGTEVPLGYYTSNSNQKDDYGRFVDYGNNAGTTKDPNGEFYVYHFWAPLSTGESYDEVVVNYHVEAINGVGSTTYNGGSEVANARGGMTAVSEGFNASDKFNSQPISLFTQNFAVVTNMRDDWHENTLYAYNPSVRNNKFVITDVAISDAAKNSHVNANNERINPLVETLTDTVTNGLRYSTSFSTNTLSIVGRIGSLTVVDSGDPRWQDTFKVAGNTYAIAPIVKAVSKYSNKGILETNVEGAVRLFAQDIIDVRGRYVLEVPANYTSYSHGNVLNTYSTQTFKDKATAVSLPVKSEYNVHDSSFNLEGVKLGYELLCSLETIGNYFGSVSKRTTDASELPSNNNGDYGQTKIQIRPVYFGVKADGTIEPADVYMRKGSNYALINAGSPYYSNTQATADIATTSYDSFYYDAPYYVDALHTADYTVTIPTNTYVADANGDNLVDATNNNAKTGLDSNMLRRLVTNNETNATLRSLDIGRKFITTSIIDNYTLNGGGAIGAVSLDNEYAYGNAQMMYLRENNRTLIGGASTALAFKDANIMNAGEATSFLTDNAEQYSQKWYFGLQLPSNALFVKHGATASAKNGSYFQYAICAIEVYAVGEKWVLRYESPISQADIKILNNTYSWNSWNKFYETNPYLLPVAYFDLTDNASSDFDTRGAY